VNEAHGVRSAPNPSSHVGCSPVLLKKVGTGCPSCGGMLEPMTCIERLSRDENLALRMVGARWHRARAFISELEDDLISSGIGVMRILRLSESLEGFDGHVKAAGPRPG